MKLKNPLARLRFFSVMTFSNKIQLISLQRYNYFISLLTCIGGLFNKSAFNKDEIKHALNSWNITLKQVCKCICVSVCKLNIFIYIYLKEMPLS